MSAIAYYDADHDRPSTTSAPPRWRRSERPARRSPPDRRRRPRLPLRQRPLGDSRDGRLPPLRQLRRLRPALRPAPHVVQRGGPGRRARAALDRAPGRLRAGLPPELPAAEGRLHDRLLPRGPQRRADRGGAVRARARAHRDHRVLARQRRRGEADALVAARSSPTSPTSRSTTACPRGLPGGHGPREKVAAGSTMAAVFVAMALVAETGARLAGGLPLSTFVSPERRRASRRPQPGGLRGLRPAARRSEAHLELASRLARAPGRAAYAGISCSAS